MLPAASARRRRRRPPAAAAALLALLAGLLLGNCAPAAALRVEQAVRDEQRQFFAIEEFGFVAGGELILKVRNFVYQSANPTGRAGLLVVRADTENAVLDKMRAELKEETAKDQNLCPLDDTDLLLGLEFPPSDPKDQEKHVLITADTEGIYEVSFVHCGEPSPVDFDFSSEMFNPGPNYLTAGEAPLPTVLFVFGLVFSGMLAGWISVVRRNKLHAHMIHHLLTAFLLLKVLAIFAQAIDKHFIKVNGVSITWNFLFHLLRALRAIMFFLVVVLIGTGWSLLKPALDQRERKTLLFVLPLQLLANIALAIADELPQGSSAFMHWRDLFILVDILCCMLVAFPIVAHISHLERSTAIEGKEAVNLVKLKQFRRFYLTVLIYAYFTRVIAFLFANMLNFKLQWLHVVVEEVASIVFYVLIAKAFRPTNRSQYLQLSPNERDDYEGSNSSVGDMDPYDQDMFFESEHQSEFGLREDVVELTVPRSAARSRSPA